MTKLVRDRIPEIIAERGGSGSVRRARDQEELRELLRLKLMEEAAEVAQARGGHDVIMELADVVEVCLALARAHGFVPENLESARRVKLEGKGGFDEQWVLEDWL